MAVQDQLQHQFAAEEGQHQHRHRRQRPAHRGGAAPPVALAAQQQGDEITLTISDDGRGIDRRRVREHALRQGIRTAAELDRLADSDLLGLILLPGFSTAKQVSDLSGRGVGMDVVRTNLQQIGVNLTLTPISFPDWLSLLSDWDNIPQMFLMAEFAQLPDPGGMLVPYFMSTSVGTNRSGYSNPEVDELLNSALATGDADERCSAYEEAQRIIDEDMVSVNMYTFARPFGYSESVQNFHLIGAGSGPYIPDIRKS